VAGAAHDVVEGDFEDAEGFDGAEVAVVFEGVGLEPSGEFEDFGVGDAAVGFAYVQEFAVWAADGERVVGEQAGALAVAILGACNDDVEGGELAFEFDPAQAAAAGLIVRVGGFEHDAFVGASAGVGVGLVDGFGGGDEGGGGEIEAGDGWVFDWGSEEVLLWGEVGGLER